MPTRALILLLIPSLLGCDTIGADLADFSDGLFAPTPGEAARMALDPKDADARRRGTLLIANAPFGGEPSYLKMYRDYVPNEQNPLVKAVAIRALARHGDASDAKAIAQQLVHPNEMVRWEAAKGLQRLHEPAVVPDLLAVLRRGEDETPEVRVAAAVALGQYPEDRVFQGLLAALDDRDLVLNRAAEGSLEVLTGQELGLDPRDWLNWYNAHADEAFAAGGEYLYPTYTRDPTWFERLAFWSSRVEEQPASPTGLRSAGTRRTYDDEGDDDAHGGKPEANRSDETDAAAPRGG